MPCPFHSTRTRQQNSHIRASTSLDSSNNKRRLRTIEYKVIQARASRSSFALMMKVVQTAFLLDILVKFAAAQELVYCGQFPCIVPTKIACSVLVETYNFQGSCCSLADVNGTCTVTVAAAGTCLWRAKCGSCMRGVGCDKQYQTSSALPCTSSIYDVLNPASHFTAAPSCSSSPPTSPSLAPVLPTPLSPVPPITASPTIHPPSSSLTAQPSRTSDPPPTKSGVPSAQPSSSAPVSSSSPTRWPGFRIWVTMSTYFLAAILSIR